MLTKFIPAYVLVFIVVFIVYCVIYEDTKRGVNIILAFLVAAGWPLILLYAVLFKGVPIASRRIAGDFIALLPERKPETPEPKKVKAVEQPSTPKDYRPLAWKDE